ncbi:hypothetical protein NMR63_002573 [Vibrio cholerae]|uniref:hypothetical protein n=1 Tax=Vibrio cholerae TaxID=666 RepID=UPI00084CEDAD|nr:hypothetical protein [Vibrio cholerae]EGQ9396132.1 hypothetical protein [Vibrio cholerae]EJL6332010.1 hypothetical protein [Vibrio cholerae]EKG0411176.1 hypothetical protein [Vibrio cholerae]OEG76061.1 hypothetical protein VCS12_18310 [Vibrio cholerae]
MGKKKNKDTGTQYEDKRVPVQESYDKSSNFSRDFPTDGMNKSNNICQSQMTPPRPKRGNGDKK